MSTNPRRSTAIPSFLRRIGDSFKHAWGAIRPGPLAWKGAALGLLATAVPPFLITAYSVFLAEPHIFSFLVSSAEFFAIAALAGALAVLLVALLRRIPAFYGWALVVALVGGDTSIRSPQNQIGKRLSPRRMTLSSQAVYSPGTEVDKTSSG